MALTCASFDRVSGGFVYHSGGPFQAPYDILVDNIYAKSHQSKVGQTIHLLNHDFRVAGIVEQGKGARMYIPLSTAQDLLAHRKSIDVLRQVHGPRVYRPNHRRH